MKLAIAARDCTVPHVAHIARFYLGVSDSACKYATPPERKGLKPVGARLRISVSERRGSFSSEARRGCSLNGKLLIAQATANARMR